MPQGLLQQKKMMSVSKKSAKLTAAECFEDERKDIQQQIQSKKVR